MFKNASKLIGVLSRAKAGRMAVATCSIATVAFMQQKKILPTATMPSAIQLPFMQAIAEAAASVSYPANVVILNQKHAIIDYLLSQLRDKDTTTAEYRHFSGRIMHLLVEEAISRELVVDTKEHYSPTGSTYPHLKLKHAEEEFCAISILRAGDSMVEPTFQLLPNISVGKILIQRNEKTAEPIFFYQKMPTDLKDSKRVFLLDPMLATGGSASMAINKLVECGVPAENITFINLIACDKGI